jgi:Putative Ig domain
MYLCLTPQHFFVHRIMTEANDTMPSISQTSQRQNTSRAAMTTNRSTTSIKLHPLTMFCLSLMTSSWSLSSSSSSSSSRSAANAFVPPSQFHHHHSQQQLQHFHGRLPFVTSSSIKTVLREPPLALLQSTRLDRRADNSTTMSAGTNFQPTLLEATYLSNSTMLDFILQTKPDILTAPKKKGGKKQKKKDKKPFALFGCLVAEPGLGHATRKSVLQEIQEKQQAKQKQGGAKLDRPNIAPRCTSLVPHMNSAPVFGLRPGSPAQYLIATTGERSSMRFSICPRGEICNVHDDDDNDDDESNNHGLPAGLVLDTRNGVITGTTQERGTFDYTLVATNRHGIATRDLTIVVGDDAIALTPPRGISTWNSCGDTVSAAKVRAIAAASIQHGLRDHGYTYLVSEECQ